MELRQNPLLSRANDLNLYDFDGADNGVYLPNTPEAAAAARADPNWTNPTPIHNSGHPQYSAEVQRIARQRQIAFEAEHGPIANMTDAQLIALAPEINDLVEGIQQSARDLLTHSTFVIDGVLQ